MYKKYLIYEIYSDKITSISIERQSLNFILSGRTCRLRRRKDRIYDEEVGKGSQEEPKKKSIFLQETEPESLAHSCFDAVFVRLRAGGRGCASDR